MKRRTTRAENAEVRKGAATRMAHFLLDQQVAAQLATLQCLCFFRETWTLLLLAEQRAVIQEP